MKKSLLLLNLLYLTSFLSAQTDHIQIKAKSGELFPHIAGFFRDEIPIEKLGAMDGIQCNGEAKIISFMLTYPQGAGVFSQHFEGNRIPDTIVIDIQKSCLGEAIYITEIKAMKPEGKICVLPSMSLTPIWKEE